MDFEREWNVDAAADRQQAHDPALDALAARVKGHPIQPGTMRTVATGPDGAVVLPAGTDINQIEVDGRNLIVTLPDGTQMVILDGAVVVPRIVVGDVEIPSVNLAALLIGEEPQPAAGPARSSGGNFLAAEGDVGNPHGLGDLLPPTELAFTQPEEREILPIAPDEEEDHVPELEVPTSGAGTVVDEAGLGTVNRPGESPGSNEPAAVETTTGTITYVALDTPATIRINDQVVTGPGQTITGTSGTLTIISVAPGVIEYSYTVTDNTAGDTVTDNFTVTVTDADGDSVTKTLVVNVIDDVPTAHDDLAHQGTEGAPVVINALANDVFGADGVDIDNNPAVRVTIVSGPAEGAVVYDPATGLFTFTPAAGQEGTASFVYQIQDGDGDTSQATVTVTLQPDSTPTVEVQAGSDTLVDEAALNPNGSNADSGAETAAGALIVTTGNDTVGSLVINDVDVTNGGTVKGSFGTLTVTGSPASGYSYSYTLETATSGDNTKDSFAVTVTDSDGDAAATTLTIGIVDDVPQAIDDVGNVVIEDGAINSLSGNVLSNDVSGADTPKSFVAWGANTAAVSELNSYGTLVQNSDGSWSYVLDNSRAATQALGSGFAKDFTLHYTMTDADGDQSPATLTITVKGADDSARVVTAAATGPDATVYEAGLPSGSLHNGSHVTSGSFTVSATDGIASITVGGTSFTLAQMQAFGTTNGVVNTGEGTLTLTGYNAATGAVSYSYTLLATIDNDSKNGATLTEFDDSIALSVTGIGGTSGSDTLVVRIVDDVPVAVNDAGGTLTEDVAGSLSGNVLNNDVSGADTPKGFVAWGADAAVVAELNSYGTLVQNSDGSWSYVLDNSRAATQALGSGFSKDFTLHYTMTDADGDQSPATLTITVKGADDSASVVTASLNGPDATVYEAGLPSGTANDGSHVTSGSFTVSATDGIASITVGGTSFTLAQMQAFGTTNGVVNTGEGTLTLTGYNAATGAVSYSYTLLATIDNDSKNGATLTEFDDSIALSVTGISGTSGSDTLVVRIVDDVPVAVNDAGGTLTEDVAGSLSGNVLSNDVSGADTPKSFVAWGADATAVAELNSYGTLVQNSDGSWSYVLDNSRAATQALGSGFSKDFTLHYTMTDADSDQSPATLTITVKGAADSASVVTASLNGPDATVYEAGLPSGTANDGSHVTSGSFTVSATDGIASITVGGTSFTLAQMQAFGSTNGVVNTGEGTLTLSGYNAATGAVSYSYTLLATIDNDSKNGATPTEFDDSVTVTVTGISGTSGSDTLVVRIVDDAPVAVNEADSVTEGLGNKADGNVFIGVGGTDANATDGTADTIGADGAAATGAVTGARVGTEAGGGALTAVSAAGVTISGTYGDLLIKADGSYTYTLKTASIPAAVTSETFTYQITDGDGDTDLAQLVISLNQDVRAPDVTGDTSTVYEDGLADGLQHGATSETDPTGQFTVNANGESYTLMLDGDLNPAQTITAVGQQVVTSKGVLTITSISAPDVNGVVTYGYSYTLAHALTHSGQGEINPLTDTISMSVTDATGDSDTSPGSIVISIVDDVPVAANDAGGTLTEDVAGNLSGNVLSNDVSGADTPKSFVAWGANTAAVSELNSYGTLVQNSDGSWSYVLDNSRAATQALGSGFSKDFTLSYTMKDADGDQSSAALTITVKGAADSASVVTASLNGPDATVYEAGLPSGSLHNGTHVTSGSFTVSATDGIASITVGGTSFTLAQMQAFGTTNGVVNTGEGTLTLTGYNAATGAVSYSYTLLATIDNDSKNGATLTEFDDSVTVTVNGLNTSASDTLVVRIVDDAPTLGPVQSQQTDNNVATAPALGTLHYVAGADGTASVVITANTSSITVGGQAVSTVQNGNVLTAYVDVDHSGGFNVGDTTVFKLTVDPTAGTSGQYAFDLITKLDPTVTDVPIGSGSSFGAGPSNEIVVTDKVSLQQLVYVTGWAPTGGFTPAEIASWQAGGSVTATQTSNVNGSTQGWGLGNNNFDAGEFLRFDFGTLNDYDGAGVYSPPGSYNIVNASYATFSFFDFKAGEQIIFVAHFTNGTTQNYVVNGPDADDIQKISAPTGALIDWIDVYQSSGDMKLNLTNVGVASSSIDKTIPFTLQFTDNDTDQTSAQSFSVHVKDGLQPLQPAAPIAVDLDGDGLEFVSLAAGIHHDYGAGSVATAWVSSEDGLLAHATGGSYDIVFSDDAAGAKSDLEGLRLAYDGNGDGVFDAKDAAFGQFGVWQDMNSNGQVDAGEFKSLTAAGISSINLTSNGQTYGAVGGDVTVLGETTFTRTDGTTGTVGDVVFATSKDADLVKTESSSGFNQALIAASLVAVAGAAETVEQEPAPVVAQTETVVDTAPAATTGSVSEPAANDDDASLAVSSESQDSRGEDQPVEQRSHSGGDDAAPDHSTLSGGDDAPVHAADDDGQAQPALGDHQGLLAQTVDLPALDVNAAALVAAHEAAPSAAAAAQVVAEALGAHGGGSIDALLAALPGGDHAPVLLNPVAGEAPDAGHMMAMAASVFDAAMAAHEAMAVAHG